MEDEFYKGYLEMLFKRLEEGMAIANKEHGTKAAYMFLCIRDAEDLKGNIDVISNMKTKSIKQILEAALFTVTKELEK